MSLLKKLFASKKEKNKLNMNSKKFNTIKEENKSINDKTRKNKNLNTYNNLRQNAINNTNININTNNNSNININSNNNTNIKINNDLNIREQERQKRDYSKKAKKKIENKSRSKSRKKVINEKTKNYNITKVNKDISNENINNNENVDKVENLLKTKVNSINPNIKTSKNFLKTSINEFDFFYFNNNSKENKEKIIEEDSNKITNINFMNSKTFISKRNKNIIIDENEVNNNKEKLLKSSNVFEKDFSIEKEKDSINNLDKKNYSKENNDYNEININSIKMEEKININENYHIFVPMTNFSKENNCFLNVLIQVFSNIEDFRDYLLEKLYKKTENEVIRELCELINSYKNFQNKYKNIVNPKIEATLSVNLLRKYLNNIYGNYMPGECGDPLETLEHLFDIIHKEYLKLNPTKEDDICYCPSHKFFFLYLSEIISCPHCHNKTINSFNKECYMFNIFVPDITNKIREKNENFNSFKLNFFAKIKQQNEFYENENKIKIKGCECSLLEYTKKIKLLFSDNPYLIINITWAEEFPNMKEILTIFSLLPMSDKYNNLFDTEQKTFYIKSIILYGIYHYVCIIYINSQNKWGIIDDKTIKFIDKYYNLIDYLLRNHLMPVGVVYSQNDGDKIDENVIKNNIMSNEEYLKLYKFCEEVENNRRLNIYDIAPVKGSFNETNENYLENNLFYNSLINIINSSSDSDYEEYKKKDSSNKNIKTKKSNKFEDIKSGRLFMGDFNETNLKGGFIMLSNSYNIEDENDKNKDINDIDKKKKENEEIDFGKDYFEDKN